MSPPTMDVRRRSGSKSSGRSHPTEAALPTRRAARSRRPTRSLRGSRRSSRAERRARLSPRHAPESLGGGTRVVGSLTLTGEREGEGVASHVLEIDSLVVDYGRLVALNGVSLRFTEGVTGLLGPNGAGKSSLMRVLATASTPRSGRVLYDGAVSYTH